MNHEDSYFLNPLQRKKTFEVSDFVTAYYFSSGSDFESRWETYPFSQIFLILKGEGTYTTEQETYPFSSGMMFYRPAGKASVYKWNTDPTVVRFGLISLVCHSDAMKAFEGCPISLCEEEAVTLIDLIQTAARICEPLKESEPLLGMRIRQGTPDIVLDFIVSSLERFFSMLYCRLKNIDLLLNESQKAGKYIDDTTRSEAVKRYLCEHIEEQLTVTDLCTRFGISQTALMKIFHRENGQSPMEYFMDRKIDEAKRRIRKTSQSFSQIADDLGFSSANYFSRVFKSKTGMTPTEYSKYVSKRTVSSAFYD